MKSITPDKSATAAGTTTKNTQQLAAFPSTMLNDQMSRIREAFLLSRLSTVANPNILLQAKLQEHAQAAQRQVN